MTQHTCPPLDNVTNNCTNEDFRGLTMFHPGDFCSVEKHYEVSAAATTPRTPTSSDMLHGQRRPQSSMIIMKSDDQTLIRLDQSSEVGARHCCDLS